MWAYIKAKLKKFKARTINEFHNTIKLALLSVTPELIAGWFKHCGYS